MDKKRTFRISKYILAGAMVLFTILYCFDIKFVVIGLNILVWDMLTAGVWIFVRLCIWAGRENTGRRTLAVTAIVLAGLFAAPVLLFGLAMCGGIPQYTQGTEPQTHRTFVVESHRNMLLKGSAKVYERFGPLLFPCDVPEYKGQLTFDESDAEYAKVYISNEKQAIVVSLFTYGPRFSIPLKLPEGTEKTPERVLLEQPKDDDHDAFLVKTGGAMGTLLVTAERERTPTLNCDFTVHFSVWDPASMDEPLQTLTDYTNIFGGWNVIDTNFDGYMDFTFTYLRGNASNYDHLWLWDENHGQFVRRSDYDEISNPILDVETETIYGFNRSSGGGTGEHTFYQWSESQLLCVRRIEIYTLDQSGTVRMSVQDQIAGDLVEIYHEDFTPESSGWLEAETVWHDLDYHGEPGGLYDLFQQQQIDDWHDAFFVPTNGERGTLLVTAELAEESRGEFGTRDITFSVWNPAEMEEPIQTFSEEFMMGVAPEFHHVVDANFDGFQDFGYLFYLGNQPSYCHYWLWNEEQTQFIYCAPLVEISQPGFDEENQVITGWVRCSGAGDGVTTFHRWENGELVCVRLIVSYYSPSEGFAEVRVEDRINGELQQVYYEEFPQDVEEVEGKEAWQQAQYMWSDLDYHGEPTEGQ